MTRLAVAATLGIALAVAAVSFAAAQGGPDVQISQLDCTGDPELVVLTNAGDAAQALTGWELRSDPEASEVFDLSVLGSLLTGGSVSVQSGPSSSSVFSWGTDEIFRDNDPTDYVKLVNGAGATVQQVNCAGAAAGPTPTPSPEPSPVNGIPNGGGPPPPPGSVLSQAMIVLIGGSLATAGVAIFALPRLRPLHSLLGRARQPAHRSPDGAHGESLSTALGLALVGLTAAVVFCLLWRRRA